MGRKKTKQPKPKTFEFEIGDELIYTGFLYAEYTNQIGKVINRNKQKGIWFRVQFEDGSSILTSTNMLKRRELLD